MKKEVKEAMQEQIYQLKDCMGALQRETEKLKKEHPELDNDRFIQTENCLMALEGDISVLDEIHWALEITTGEIERIINDH